MDMRTRPGPFSSGHPWIFSSDLRLAVRLLVKHAGFTALAVLVLALGIGANSAAFGIVNTLLIKPRVGRPAGALVSLYSRDSTKPDSYRPFSFTQFTDLRARTEVFASLSAHSLTIVGLKEGDGTRRLFVDIVTRDFFDTFGVGLALGRGFTADEERPGADLPVAVLSHSLWQRLGGTPDLVGRTIALNGRAFTVVGVAPRGFGGLVVMFTPDAFVPTGVYDSLQSDLTRDGLTTSLADPRHYDLFLVGQLIPGATVASVAPALETIGAQMAAARPAELKDRAVTAAPLSRLSISTSPTDDGQLIPVSALLLTMSLVVLFIASFNLANMLLARNGARAKEFAIRMAIGGSRARVVRQLVTEGILLSLLGGLGGLALASGATWILLAALRPLVPVSVSFDAAPDVRIIGATFVFCLLSTVVFGLGPAVRASRRNLVPELKEQAGELAKRSRFALRDVLVMGQLALSLVMLTVAGLFVRGALDAARTDPGFTFARGVVMNVDASLAGRDQAQTRALYQHVQERLRAVPGVAAVSFGSIMPFGDISESRGVQKPGAPVEGARSTGAEMRIGSGGRPATAQRVDAIATSVGAGYFDALGLPVLYGRDFTDAEVFAPAPTHIVIIDTPLARQLFGRDDAVGERIQYAALDEQAPPVVLQVVGVAPGTKQSLFDREPVPHLFTPLSQDFRAGVFFHVRTAFAGPSAVATEAAMLPQLRGVLRDLDATLPVLSLETRGQYADRNFLLALVRVGAGIFGVFGAVALVLASIGVYRRQGVHRVEADARDRHPDGPRRDAGKGRLARRARGPRPHERGPCPRARLVGAGGVRLARPALPGQNDRPVCSRGGVCGAHHGGAGGQLAARPSRDSHRADGGSAERLRDAAPFCTATGPGRGSDARAAATTRRRRVARTKARPPS